MNTIFRRPWILCLAALIGCTSALAQDSLTDSERATVIFDVDVDKLRKDPLLKSIPIEKMLEDEGILPPARIFNAKAVARVYGAVQLPESMDDVMGMGPDSNLPFNFFVRVKFNDVKELEKFYKEISENAGKLEKDGKTYLKAPEGEKPDNIFIHRIDKSTLEVGSDKYVFRKDRNVVTETLAKSWKKLEKGHAVRVAYDVEASREFLDGAMDMLMEDAPMGESEIEIFKEVVSFVKDVKLASLSLDFSGEKMMELISESKDSKGAEAVKETLDGLLFIARTGGKAVVKQMPIKDKKATAAMVAIVNQLKAKQKENVVSITVNRPEDFDDAMKSVLAEIRVQQAKLERMNNFRQFAIAVHNYHDSYRGLPFHARERARQHKDLSWRVRILPFAEMNQIYDQMEISQPWDHESNKKWATKMPKAWGKDGKNTSICWIKSDMKTLEQVSNADGTSNTIMFLENPAGVPWTQNKDLTVLEAVKLVKNLKDGEELVAVMYDASTRMISNKMKLSTVKAMLTPDGGEAIEYDDDRPRRAMEKKVVGDKFEGGKKKRVGKKRVEKKRVDKK